MDKNTPDGSIAVENVVYGDFSTWFGNSKVAHESGRPLIVYHGTGATFDVFDPAQIGSANEFDSEGFFFTNSEEDAKLYASIVPGTFGDMREGVVMPVFIKMENPLVITRQNAEMLGLDHYFDEGTLYDNNRQKILQMVKAGRHDGIILEYLFYDASIEPGTKHYVAFEPSQIRSAVGYGADLDPRSVALVRADMSAEATRSEIGAWFGGSKVVSEAGSPLVVHHGTNTHFDEFSLDYAQEGGFFFSKDIDHARCFGNTIMSVHLSLQNPYFVDGATIPEHHEMEDIENIIHLAKQHGHDGVIISGFRDAGKISDTYVAFHPGQIKTAISHAVSEIMESEERIYFSSRQRVVDCNAANPGQLMTISMTDQEEDIARGLPNADSELAKWFEDSKAINEANSPLVVYHGTNQEFTAFDRSVLGSNTATQSSKLGFYFTDSREVAQLYADKAARTMVPNAVEHESKVSSLLRQIEQAERRGDWSKVDSLTHAVESLEADALQAEPSGQRVIEAHLRMINPLVIDDAHSIEVENYVSRAKLEGYDGVILKDIADDPFLNETRSTHYVVFDADAIRLIAPAECRSSNLLGELCDADRQRANNAAAALEMVRNESAIDDDLAPAKTRRSP